MGLFGFGKKEKVEVVSGKKKRTLKIAYDDLEYNIGKTFIHYYDDKGELFETVVYGEVGQYCEPGSDESYNGVCEPKVSEVGITYSKDIARWRLNELNAGMFMTIVDDPKNVRKSFCSKFVRAIIINTVDHNVTYRTAKVVPV